MKAASRVSSGNFSAAIILPIGLAIAAIAPMAAMLQATPVFAAGPTPDPASRHAFVLLGGENKPVIDRQTPGAEGIQYGFEGGGVVRHDGYYYYFPTERVGEPRSVKTRIGCWRSADGVTWQRVSTLYESSGDYTGQDLRAALWAAMPFYNERENRWNLFYVSYRAQPDTDYFWLRNFHGTIWRAVSRQSGPAGLAGPYGDDTIVLKPGRESDPWEGLQGTDSFYLYRVDQAYYAFYGSAPTQFRPAAWQKVGLIQAPEMSGPWKRCSDLNPVDFGVDVENPIVAELAGGGYAMVCDLVRGNRNAIAYAFSNDGVHWSRAVALDLSAQLRSWWTDVRTPVSLIRERDGTYTVFFCAYTKANFESVGLARLKLAP